MGWEIRNSYFPFLHLLVSMERGGGKTLLWLLPIRLLKPARNLCRAGMSEWYGDFGYRGGASRARRPVAGGLTRKGGGRVQRKVI